MQGSLETVLKFYKINSQVKLDNGSITTYSDCHFSLQDFYKIANKKCFLEKRGSLIFLPLLL